VIRLGRYFAAAEPSRALRAVFEATSLAARPRSRSFHDVSPFGGQVGGVLFANEAPSPECLRNALGRPGRKSRRSRWPRPMPAFVPETSCAGLRITFDIGRSGGAPHTLSTKVRGGQPAAPSLLMCRFALCSQDHCASGPRSRSLDALRVVDTASFLLWLLPTPNSSVCIPRLSRAALVDLLFVLPEAPPSGQLRPTRS